MLVRVCLSEESVKDEFLSGLQEKSAKIAVGDPMDKATQDGSASF